MIEIFMNTPRQVMMKRVEEEGEREAGGGSELPGHSWRTDWVRRTSRSLLPVSAGVYGVMIYIPCSGNFSDTLPLECQFLIFRVRRRHIH